MTDLFPNAFDATFLNSKTDVLRACLKSVVSGFQPGKHGAQEPEHTRQYVRIPQSRKTVHPCTQTVASTARPRIMHAQQLSRHALRFWADTRLSSIRLLESSMNKPHGEIDGPDMLGQGPH